MSSYLDIDVWNDGTGLVRYDPANAPEIVVCA